MTGWPPRDAMALRQWIGDEGAQLRWRRARHTVLLERIAQAEALARTPPATKTSQIGFAHTSVSDPTYRMARMYAEILPGMREEANELGAVLSEYERSKAALDAEHRSAIEAVFERPQHEGQRPSSEEIASALSASRTVLYQRVADALGIMASVLAWMHEAPGAS